jgi:hypothetical protein
VSDAARQVLTAALARRAVNFRLQLLLFAVFKAFLQLLHFIIWRSSIIFAQNEASERMMQVPWRLFGNSKTSHTMTTYEDLKAFERSPAETGQPVQEARLPRPFPPLVSPLEEFIGEHVPPAKSALQKWGPLFAEADPMLRDH